MIYCIFCSHIIVWQKVRELRTTSAQKESALRRAATFFEEFIYAMHQARFEAKKKIPLSLMQNQQQKQTPQSHSNPNSNSAANAHVHDAAIDTDVAHKDNNANGGGGNTANHANASEPKKKDSTKQKDNTNTTSKGRELIAGLNLDYQADAKLKGLQDILKPYIIDVKVEVSISLFSKLESANYAIQITGRNYG